MYKDRQGNVFRHDATPDKTIRFLYRTVPGRWILERMIDPDRQEKFRRMANAKWSSILVNPFAKKYHIDFKEYVPSKYRSYNAFFTRRIKPECRPIEEDDNLLACPCDGRLTAYRISDRLVMSIKNTEYSVKSLLRNRELAEEFADGWCLVIRLTIEDYHRYCYPDDGYKSDDMFIPGLLHTVSPIVLEHANVYAENQRVYTVIDTEHFGRIIQMEIGALAVGRIVNHDDEGEICRGDEKGYFEFGGSTVVLLLKSDAFTPDSDIIDNTKEGYETIVKMGERIGFNEKYQG